MSTTGRFGTFAGVFTPSILTILGVIMFLRLPLIVGEAGLTGAIAIILIAHLISFTTGLSVASIATDKRVKVGGTYYMISRSLGLPIGGTLGIALFVGLSFSVSLYLIGFAESFLGYWGFEVTPDNIRLTGSILLVAVTAITFISTSLAIRTQYFIMAAIVLALLSVFFGTHDAAPGTVNLPAPESALPFMVLFGIFFPAVTGFEAGVSMSGDLRDPKKSIPVGSLSAIVVGLVVYIGLTVFLAETVDPAVLAGDDQVLLTISFLPQLVVAGIWGATLSSALGSILGAPRILQATALDKITHDVFSRGSGATDEPRNALLLTFVIAEAGILIGELNLIARIVSIFFITTYGFLNLSCAFERWTSADFRPEFRTPIWVSLTGATACFIVMVQLDFLATIGGTLLLGGLFLFLKRKELRLESGDAWSGVWASLVKAGIDRLTRSDTHERNWRPNIVMFKGQDDEREHLDLLGNAITGRIGMLSRFEFVVRKEGSYERLESLEDSEELDGFSYRHVCPDIYTGMRDVVRLYGFTGVRPNTVLMGWNTREKLQEDFVNYVRMLDRTDVNAVFLRYGHGKGFGTATTVDLWWSGDGSDASFAITLLRLITTSPMWQHARMRLLIINPDSARSERIYRRARRILEEYRISMEVRVVENENQDLPAKEVIVRESASTDLTIIGLTDGSGEDLEHSVERAREILHGLGTTLVIHSSSKFQDLDIGLDASKEPIRAPQELDIPLPDLRESATPELASDLQKIDANGQRVLKLLYEKVTRPWTADLRETAVAFRDIGESAYASVGRISSIKESYRRRRAILRIQNDYLYRSRTLVDSLKEESLSSQKDAMATGLKQYSEKLRQDIRRFPKSIVVQYPDTELKRRPGDTLSETAVKTWKRLQRRLSGAPSARAVAYRTIAEEFLLSSRHMFLERYLDRFSLETSRMLLTLKTHMISLASDLVELEDLISQRELSPEEIEKRKAGFASDMEGLIGQIEQSERLYLHRLQLEFRKNLNVFAETVSRFNGARRVAERRVSSKHLRATMQRNLSFAGRWLESTGRVINKVYLDIAIASLRGRVNDRMDEFASDLSQRIDSYLQNPLKSLLTHLKTRSPEGSDTPLEFTVSRSFDLSEGLDDAHEDILDLTRSLPDSLEVTESAGQGAGSPDPVDIPLVRLTQYHLEADLLGPVQELLAASTEKLRKSAYAIKDLVNLTQFGIENVNPDLPDQSTSVTALLKRAINRVEREMEKTVSVRKEVITGIHSRVDAAFDTLAPHTVERSATEFTDVLRDYKGKQVATAFGRFGRTVASVFEEGVVRILYGRSEGVLLAKRIADTGIPHIASMVQSMVESVSPRPEVIRGLPQFYINLFSGRSSIGDEFWIERPEESATFEKSLSRFRSGQRGAITILGDRNSGKTAFCRNISAQHFKRGFNFHVFPPREGSVDPSVFKQTLTKATGHKGGVESAVRALPRGSVLVFHDIELWFERRPDGLEVLQTLLGLIESFSQDVLFVLNTNAPSFSLLSTMIPLREVCIDVITLTPMNAEDLGELIALRHQSSGLTFQLGKTPERELSRLRRARLFARYFDVSQGNPGVALNFWLASISRIRDMTIHIDEPEPATTAPLESIPDDWLLVLAHCILQKRLTVQKIDRSGFMSEEQARRLIRHMHAAGLLEERVPGIYMVNQFIDPYVRQVLRGRKLI